MAKPSSTEWNRRKAALLDLFTRRAHQAEPYECGAVTAEAVELLGLRDGQLFLTDLPQRLLVRVAPSGEAAETLPIEGTIAGRAFTTNTIAAAHDEDTHRLWVPVVDGADRLGVIGLTAGDTDDEDLRSACASLAHLIASLVLSKSLTGDALPLVRRRQPLTLAAELRWSMLPPLTCASPRIGIAGVLEPAYEIAGDSFDYALNPGTAHVAIFDAVGHGLSASRLVNLALGSYRHSRRHGLDLAGSYHAMDDTIVEEFGDAGFVTAQLATISLDTGRLQWLNAGHPRPLLLRGVAASMLEGDVCLPAGLSGIARRPGWTADVCETQLEPGDQLLFYSDGVTEARSPIGDEFGTDRLGDLLVRSAAAGYSPAETVRRLTRAVLDHQNDRLQDDATMVLVCWQKDGGPTPEDPPLP
ncbi:MAG TPA: PP2C family protein-serine/threonine phosphatase [Acidimicrobiales bacterium]|nr:PP2C family protein-serine/threonine phosphatase [Acidimicrobiales bacterium]